MSTSVSLGSRLAREAAHLKQAVLLTPSGHPELVRKDHALHHHATLTWRVTNGKNAGRVREPVELVIQTDQAYHDLPAFERAVDALPFETTPPNLHHALVLGKRARRLSLGEGTVVYAARELAPTATLSCTHFFDSRMNKIGDVSYNPSDASSPVLGTFKDHALAPAVLERFYDGTLAP